MIIMGLVLIIAGVVLVGIGRRSLHDKLPRNALAGFRTKTTMESDEAWYAAQRAGAELTYTAGIFSIIGGIASAAFFTNENVSGVIALVTTGIILTLVIIGGIKGQRAAREVG